MANSPEQSTFFDQDKYLTSYRLPDADTLPRAELRHIIENTDRLKSSIDSSKKLLDSLKYLRVKTQELKKEAAHAKKNYDVPLIKGDGFNRDYVEYNQGLSEQPQTALLSSSSKESPIKRNAQGEQPTFFSFMRISSAGAKGHQGLKSSGSSEEHNSVKTVIR